MKTRGGAFLAVMITTIMENGDVLVTGTSERQLHAALIFHMTRAGFSLKAESEHALEFESARPDPFGTFRSRLRVTTVERVEHEIYVHASLETWIPEIDGERPRDTPGADRWVAGAASSINGAAVTELPE